MAHGCYFLARNGFVQGVDMVERSLTGILPKFCTLTPASPSLPLPQASIAISIVCASTYGTLYVHGLPRIERHGSACYGDAASCRGIMIYYETSEVGMRCIITYPIILNRARNYETMVIAGKGLDIQKTVVSTAFTQPEL